jgi:histidine triad (HIT) family protein
MGRRTVRQTPAHCGPGLASGGEPLHATSTSILTGYCKIVCMADAIACPFCRIVKGEISAAVVFADEQTLAFLDERPLFPGHCLLIPKNHCETLADLAEDLIAPLFGNARMLAEAVERAMGGEGSFVAINNRVSQSVPHLHVHVVPRRKKDGLRGFFWPRHKYESAAEIERVQDTLREAIRRIRHEK